MTSRLAFAAVAAALLAGAALPAQAAEKRMVTYDSVSPDARRLTGAGLTFVFTKSFFQTRILAVRATAVPVGVIPKASQDGENNRQMDALMGEDRGRGALYEIDEAKEQGRVMIQAFCPGSTKGWLAIGAVNNRKPLRVYAFGDGQDGRMKVCAAMDFTWRGEWSMPKPKGGDTTAAVFKPDYGRPGS
jgi:hypothetical protein